MSALSAFGTGAGAGLGSFLGQAGDILSAPRRALWGIFGGPETGDELVSSGLGLERGSALSQALGLGAEMILDPLTFGGAFLGGPAAKALAAPWQRGRQLNSTMEAMQSAKSLGSGALAEGKAAADALRSAVPEVAEGLGVYNLPGIAAGEAKAVRFISPNAAEALGGLMSPAGEGGSILGGLASNRGLPGGMQFKPFMGMDVGRPSSKMIGTGVVHNPAQRPLPFMGAEDVASLSGQAGGQSELAHQLAVNQLQRALPGESSLGAVIGRSNLAPEIANMPFRQGLNELEALLPGVAREAARYRLTPQDLAMIGGAGLGAAGGGYMGFQGY